MPDSVFPDDTEGYAMNLADDSFNWYRSHAVRSRKAHKLSELLIVVLSAAIPVSGLIGDRQALTPSLIGAVVFILVGLRSTFHWQENYFRFSQAREAVEAERRRFLVGSQPYDNPETRAEVLVERVTTIEQEEMGTWLRIATKPGANQLATRTTSLNN